MLFKVTTPDGKDAWIRASQVQIVYDVSETPRLGAYEELAVRSHVLLNNGHGMYCIDSAERVVAAIRAALT